MRVKDVRGEWWIAAVMAAVGYPLMFAADMPWSTVTMFTAALAMVAFADELAWAVGWPLRWWWGWGSLSRRELAERIERIKREHNIK